MKFAMCKPYRKHKQFLWIESADQDLWYNEHHNVWGTSDQMQHMDGGYSSSVHCNSLRAFRRHLRRHPELKGKRMRLCHRQYYKTGGELWIEATGG